MPPSAACWPSWRSAPAGCPPGVRPASIRSSRCAPSDCPVLGSQDPRDGRNRRQDAVSGRFTAVLALARSSLIDPAMQANEQIPGRSPGSVVDIPRKKVPKTKRNVALAAGAILAVVAITGGLSRLQAAAPPVGRGGVWADTGERGALPRQGEGPRPPVPGQIRWVTAGTAG